MGTYANIYIEYYNKTEDKWELINPTYSSKTINSCWRQGIVRDLLDDRGWYQTPTKSGYPKNMSNELSEILKKEEEDTEYKPYNKGYITLDKFIDYIDKKIKENEESIKNAYKRDDITICNLKIDLIAKYILTKEEGLVESIKHINNVTDIIEELECVAEYKEEIDSLQYALEFCRGIMFLVGFLTDTSYDLPEENVRIVYYFD
jgi:hypothetical protein